jgi:hypothetical protein
VPTGSFVTTSRTGRIANMNAAASLIPLLCGGSLWDMRRPEPPTAVA